MRTFLCSCILLTSFVLQAQKPSQGTLQQEIAGLSQAAYSSFAAIKTDQASANPEGGGRKIVPSKVLTGASEAFITVDEENSHSYVARFEAASIEEGLKMAETLGNAAIAALEKKGFKLGKGTDVRYHKYRKTTVEFASDNIDEMGRHPSIAIGVLAQDGDTMVEFIMNEPLWK